jgi:siderophore synthetase component
MTTLAWAGPTAAAAAAAEDVLEVVAPDLCSGFRAHLPRAADVVSRRLLGAAYREGLLDPTGRPTNRRTHGFGRIEIEENIDADPAELLLSMVDNAEPVAAELSDAVVNLAIAYTRHDHIAAELRRQAAASGAVDTLDLAKDLDADAQCAFFERLATEGHNLHPCARTRLGWSVPDLLAHDVESARTEIRVIGVRRELHVGDDLTHHLGHDAVSSSGLDPGRYALSPVHAWQLEAVIRRRYADLLADRTLVPVDGLGLPATPTAALRTLLLPPTAGDGRYLKLSLDIQVTSTRRTISVASTRNGPALSALLGRLLTGDGSPVLLLAEVAGSAVVAGDRCRDLAAIVRKGLTGRLAPGEMPVPGSALYAVSPLTGTTIVAEIVDRYARTRRRDGRSFADRGAAALAFFEDYARLVLPSVLTLATRHGIGLEAHLQNCVPTFIDGVPCRLALRDFAGLRLYPPRLRHRLDLWPGSIIVTDSLDTMRAKLAYTALQAHLGELVVRLVASHGLDERAAWLAVRAIVDSMLRSEGPRSRAAGAAQSDHAFLTARTVPHKALLRMRLNPAAGDIYVPVENPLR